MNNFPQKHVANAMVSQNIFQGLNASVLRLVESFLSQQDACSLRLSSRYVYAQLAAMAPENPFLAACSPVRLTQGVSVVAGRARNSSVHATQRRTHAASLPANIEVEFKALCMPAHKEGSSSHAIRGMLVRLSQLDEVSREEGVRVICERLFEARPGARPEIVWQLRERFEDAFGDSKLFTRILSWLTRSLDAHIRALARHQSDVEASVLATQTASHVEICIYVVRFSSGLEDEECARTLRGLLGVAGRLPAQERPRVYAWIVEIARVLPARCLDEALNQCIHEY
ncbi:hypothetical protein [Noviherbaspirillum pedocola]|uniref:Uncharacterized protein n=1 Tax=Noviherbaspirillum pedocola TaxID=2801341 RepID=A0A934SSL8_9BURK|nr:hypothetical protein [Noviherbaspirillum pedocola]MBK4734436.1 hypothetical protein [Noviherbaspirillum pedocola]